jgi:hypothetical protein
MALASEHVFLCTVSTEAECKSLVEKVKYIGEVWNI